MQDLPEAPHQVSNSKQIHTPKANNGQVTKQIPKVIQSQNLSANSHTNSPSIPHSHREKLPQGTVFLQHLVPFSLHRPQQTNMCRELSHPYSADKFYSQLFMLMTHGGGGE